MRLKNPLAGLRSLLEKAMTKTYHRAPFKSRNRPLGLSPSPGARAPRYFFGL